MRVQTLVEMGEKRDKAKLDRKEENSTREREERERASVNFIYSLTTETKIDIFD